MVRVLVLDTALEASSVALTGGGLDIADEAMIGKGHAEFLMPQIERVMAGAGLRFSDLTKIVVSTGPGSFTGIRAGIAAARGLALALSIPVVGVSTLEALAADARAAAAGAVLAAIDARRGEVYSQLFGSDGAPITAPRALTIADAAELAEAHGAILAGSGAAVVAALAPELKVADIRPQPSIRAFGQIGMDRAPDRLPPAPLYIRPADARPQAEYAVARRHLDALSQVPA